MPQDKNCSGESFLLEFVYRHVIYSRIFFNFSESRDFFASFLKKKKIISSLGCGKESQIYQSTIRRFEESAEKNSIRRGKKCKFHQKIVEQICEFCLTIVKKNRKFRQTVAKKSRNHPRCHAKKTWPFRKTIVHKIKNFAIRFE